MSGLFGVVSTSGDCSQDLFYGTDYHSHLGTEYGGLAVMGEKPSRQIHNISQNQFKSKFYSDYQAMRGNKGVGVISDNEEQPIFISSKHGSFYIVTAGFIENKDFLARELFEQGVSFSEQVPGGGINATELIGKLIVLGDDLIDGVEKMFDRIKGSCSLLLLHRDGIYAARDRHGYTPLVLGRKDGAWAVASESSSFTNLDFQIVKFLAPREIILINEEGLVSRKPGVLENQICTFLWIYTGYPASSYEGIDAEVVRERCGRALAARDRDIEADVVAGVPDSGIAHALGYAMEAKIPYRRPLVKYTAGYGRSYTPPAQETRDLVAKMKLVPIREIIKENRIVLCDDSIVRGTQLKNFAVKKLWDCGAREVHARPACPPLMFPCRFCLSTRTTQELVARRAIKALEGRDIEDVSAYLNADSEPYKKMVEWIARDLEVTTLRYLRIEDMVSAVGLPAEKLCLYCWNGQCPSDPDKEPLVKKPESKKAAS